MNKLQVEKLFNHLKRNWLIFGPKESCLENENKPQILIEQIDDFSDLVLDQRLPFFSFKKFFVPEKETLFQYQKDKLMAKLRTDKKTVLFGVNLLDLKSILLYDQVFEKDPYYQARRQNILIVGHSFIPDSSQNIFEEVFEEDILEHLTFDIFLGALKKKKSEKGEFLVFTGSALGRKIMEESGHREYINIQFSGPVKEGALDKKMTNLKDKLENFHKPRIWEKLGERCIECGKCTIACPTCFCFRIDDIPSLEEKEGERQRCWDSCYYQEFSEVAGGHKFLDNTAKRIHFWYFHKFARIPEEFNFMGCVGCRRCAQVCPVGIDIAEVLRDIEES